MKDISLTDHCTIENLYSQIGICERIGTKWIVRTSLFGFVPFWRIPTRLERVLAQEFIHVAKQLIWKLQAGDDMAERIKRIPSFKVPTTSPSGEQGGTGEG